MSDSRSPSDDPSLDRPRAEPANTGAVPSSRRAAREARADSGPTETVPRAPSQAAQPPRQTPSTQQPAARPERAAQSATATLPPSPTAPGSTATLDDLFTGARSTEDVGSTPPPKGRRRRAGGWVALVIALALVGGVVGGGVWVWNAFSGQLQGFFSPKEREDFEPGMATGEATITIVNGDAGPQVSQKLYDAGVVKAPTSLYDYMLETSTSFTFQPGVFKLQKQMTSEAVLAALRTEDNRLESAAMLREGLTVTQTLKALSESTSIPLADFEAAVADPRAYGVDADSLEGWLFPATYSFDPGATASDIIGRLVARTVQSLDQQGVAPADRQRVLTIASIIEREARLPDDFYKVSRVIQNRLDPSNQETHGLLQMDSTAQYGVGELGDGSAASSEDALTSDNDWNTYVRKGLPIGPISNPGDAAIDAALHPADGPWFYFTTVNLDTGETVFSATYQEQLAAVEQLHAWCKDNPDSGCYR